MPGATSHASNSLSGPIHTPLTAQSRPSFDLACAARRWGHLRLRPLQCRSREEEVAAASADHILTGAFELSLATGLAPARAQRSSAANSLN